MAGVPASLSGGLQQYRQGWVMLGMGFLSLHLFAAFLLLLAVSSVQHPPMKAQQPSGPGLQVVLAQAGCRSEWLRSGASHPPCFEWVMTSCVEIAAVALSCPPSALHCFSLGRIVHQCQSEDSAQRCPRAALPVPWVWGGSSVPSAVSTLGPCSLPRAAPLSDSQCPCGQAFVGH